MGEYAKFNGKRIKIGTCENMYYLRADQASKVVHEYGDVDPIKDAEHIRFRFPFPDEDKIEPGSFENYGRTVYVSGVTVPEGVEHYSVQFTAPGYNVCLPCPESKASAWLQLLGAGGGDSVPVSIHRNDFPGAVGITQQRVWKGHLALVGKCGGCGTLYRHPTLADAEPVIVACRSEADRLPAEESRAKFWHEIADRITAGYATTWGAA